MLGMSRGKKKVFQQGGLIWAGKGRESASSSCVGEEMQFQGDPGAKRSVLLTLSSRSLRLIFRDVVMQTHFLSLSFIVV